MVSTVTPARPAEEQAQGPPQGPPSEYAPSEASSVRGATPLERDYFRLLKATAKLRVSPDTKGEKQIVLEIKRMTEAANALRDKAETENMSEQMQEQVDKAIKESESLEHYGTLRLDALSQKERQDQLNINQ